MLRSWFTKFIYLTGCLTLICGTYVISFYCLRNSIIQPFETENFREKHFIRPLYNRVYYPLRYFSINDYSLKAPTLDEHYGYLKKRDKQSKLVKNGRLFEINKPYNFDGISSMSAGFSGSSAIIKKYDDVTDGSYVVMKIGKTLSHQQDRFVPNLKDILVIDIIDYPKIPSRKYSREERESIENKFDELSGKRKLCTVGLLDSYKENMFLHCRQSGYARNIGGGCAHLFPSFTTTTVLEDLMKQCEE